MSKKAAECLPPRRLILLTGVLKHSLFWAVYIIYEITLAGAISGKFGHPLDYFLHYCLYIGLFYFFTYKILLPRSKHVFKNPIALIFILTILLGFFFTCNLLIYYLMLAFDVHVIWPMTGSKIILTNIYRFLFIIFASTGYWIALEKIRKDRKISRMRLSRAIANRQKEKVRADMLQLELDLLRAQINPHMMFNTLTFIYNELRKKEPGIAEHILSLSEFMHYAISRTEKNHEISFAEELVYIEHYLKLYCLRIPAQIKFIKKGHHNHHRVIPLILATLVENILQHGDLSQPDKPATIVTTTNIRGLSIKTRNLIRFDHARGHGIGLENLKKRLEHFYPGASQINIRSRSTTYSVDLKINL